MKHILRMSLLLIVLMGLLACGEGDSEDTDIGLTVTPKGTEIELQPEESQTFTAVSDMPGGTLVWILNEETVNTGEECIFKGIHKSSPPMSGPLSLTLTVTEQFEEAAGEALHTPYTHSWEITVLPPESECYMDEDHDGFGDPKNRIYTNKPPAHCVRYSLALDCDDTNPDIHPNAIDVADTLDNNCNGFVDEKVMLHVYDSHSEDLVDMIEMEEQGEYTVDGSAYDEESSYLIHASQPGYYSNYFTCGYGDTIEIDLEPIKPNMFNGTIFVEGHDGEPILVPIADTLVRVFDDNREFLCVHIADSVVIVHQDNIWLMNFTTDMAGRFAIDVPPGTYSLSFADPRFMFGFHETIVVGSYADIEATVFPY